MVDQAEVVRLVTEVKTPPSDAEAVSNTEDALALQFSERYADDLRYVAVWGQWFAWDGARWAPENTLRAFDLARDVCREAAQKINKGKARAALCQARTRAAVENLARGDRRHAAVPEQWDADPWILNTPNGTVDLRVGDLKEHSRESCCTKTTRASPGGSCALWLAFLDRITGGDKDLQAYLQRFAGYCLTGSTREHALAFGYGGGANGKGTFFNSLGWAMGDYHAVAPADLFMVTPQERHPTELARLRGARMVTAQETRDGARWAEEKIKALTGGDPITARFMRQDFFEFAPQFKLMLSGNHKPQLRSVDEAIRRRLHLIPFAITIPPEERDPDLSEKLKEEAGGILEWAIKGCLAWQKQGLAPPAAVQIATGDYLAAEDSLGRWLDECCVVSPNCQATNADLYSSWKGWCEASGEHAGNRKRFLAQMDDRGYHRARVGASSVRGYEGLRTKTSIETASG